MRKIKVGYLPFYIELYDRNNPKTREPMEAYMRELIGRIEDRGIEVVPADGLCRIRPEFEKAVDTFNSLGVDAVITQHLAYSPSLESIDALLRLKAPIVVFDTTPDFGILSAAATENRIMSNHGIHGVQDMCNLLMRNGRSYSICAGHIAKGKVLDELVETCRAAAAAAAFRTATVGSVGGAFPGMGDFRITDERYRKEIGCTVKYFPAEKAGYYLSCVSEAEIDAEIALDREKYAVEITNEENYRAATKSGLAVRRWMREEGIGAATVNFLGFDTTGLPKMPFTECCKMLERGEGYAGEGDVLTAGLVSALFSIYDSVTFTEMFCPDWEKDIILLSHMGESNPALAAWKPLVTDCRFRHNSCGDTAALYSCARSGHALLVNLAPMKEGFRLIVTPVEMLDAGIPGGAYTRATQGWMKPHTCLPDFLKAYSEAGGTHHLALIYGADTATVTTFGRMMGFEVVEI